MIIFAIISCDKDRNSCGIGGQNVNVNKRLINLLGKKAFFVEKLTYMNYRISNEYDRCARESNFRRHKKVNGLIDKNLSYSLLKPTRVSSEYKMT